MATYDLTQNIPTKIAAGDILNCTYSGTYKTITLPKGKYKLEVWGAQGGGNTVAGGKGGYSVGTLTLNSDKTLYVYVGGQGSYSSSKASGGFNGGGNADNSSWVGNSGGGASDIRINSTSLYARIIVAGGGGGGAEWNKYIGGAGGGTSGISGTAATTSTLPNGGTQTSPGSAGYYSSGESINVTNTTHYTQSSFGIGGSFTKSGGNGNNEGNGGGGGWYGGGGASYCSGAGGSGYVYTSSTASNYPSGCLLDSSMYLTDANTIAGNASMPSTSGSTETGHSGNGYVRITVISVDSGLPMKMKVNGEIVEASAGYVKVDGTWKEIKDVYYKNNDMWNN